MKKRSRRHDENANLGIPILNTSKAQKIYSNRFSVQVGDEEIILLLGVDNNETNNIDITTKVYLTLPSFLRLYDEMKITLDKFDSFNTNN
jgi:hypothetical protein